MIKGSCLCGKVNFKISGEVTPIQNCHAERCRKATGGAYAPELLTSKDGFTWVSGQEQINEYTAPVLNEPPAYKRAFCKKCGPPCLLKLKELIS